MTKDLHIALREAAHLIFVTNAEMNSFDVEYP